MQVPTLVALLECTATGLKSLLTHYIDATVDSQFASLRNSFETMIQSGVIGPNCDGTHFGMTLPQPTHTNTDQSSDECSHEYSNDTLTRAQEHQNNLQNEVSLSNTINTESMIKQEFDDEEDGEEIGDDNIDKCKNCENGICHLVRENYDGTCGDDTGTGENGDVHFETNVHAALENIQTNQSIISNDILPNQNNPINTEEFIKKECFQGSSITSIPLDFANNAVLNDISIDEQIEGQNTQIQTDEFDDNVDDVDDDAYYEDGEGEYLNNPNCEDCANGDCDFDHENNNNHLNNDGSGGNGDETDIEANLDEAQFDIDNVTNNTQRNNQNDEQNDNNKKFVSERNMEQSAPSSSGVRSSIRKRIQTKVIGDLVQSNGNHGKCGKRKRDQVNESVKKVKPKNVLNDDDDQEDHTNNAIGEEIVTESMTNPTQPKDAQPNRHLHCSNCPKSFERKADFTRHLRVHTGERPFHCDQCDQRFSLKGNLTRHQLAHQSIKNFRCQVCEKQFTQKVHLESHQRTHSGKRLFQCNFCEKSFTELCNRTRHEQAIHLHVKPYRCKQCGLTTTERSHIIRHIRFVHFGLPHTIKQQQALNIIDRRDPNEFIKKV